MTGSCCFNNGNGTFMAAESTCWAGIQARSLIIAIPMVGMAIAPTWAIKGVATINQPLSDGAYNCTYDNEGNLTKRTEVATGKVRDFAWITVTV